ncbi:hypothetical protein LTSEMON_2366 [Salmonella enterica subsp. enterica serovar Montevideo str. S5-403]|uniref:Uncharacterized protein n=1 Tax=Salmonella enterica subsp. enterica serovar Montevideo str. S5-403 TaxID=913242 RepID=G5Q319_SALMO|nr:hypothetical protein LTSEMON_2366 [Salmonella enterica subsp. enterica serovar Montevideo str. S5-403]
MHYGAVLVLPPRFGQRLNPKGWVFGQRLNPKGWVGVILLLAGMVMIKFA